MKNKEYFVTLGYRFNAKEEYEKFLNEWEKDENKSQVISMWNVFRERDIYYEGLESVKDESDDEFISDMCEEILYDGE